MFFYYRVKNQKKVPLGTGTDTGTVPVQMWMVPNPNDLSLLTRSDIIKDVQIIYKLLAF